MFLKRSCPRSAAVYAIEQTRSRRHVRAAQVHAEAERKKEEIRERAERELAAELERQAATEEERERLRADLVRQETERKNASQRKRALAAKLKGMENKLLKGGADSASSVILNLIW